MLASGSSGIGRGRAVRAVRLDGELMSFLEFSHLGSCFGFRGMTKRKVGHATLGALWKMHLF